MPEVDTSMLETLLKVKYQIDPKNIKAKDIPQIVIYCLDFVEESLTMSREQKKEYVVSVLTVICTNSKLTDKDIQSIKILTDSYQAAEKTVEIAERISKIKKASGNGCCIIL